MEAKGREFKIKSSQLQCVAKVPGISQEEFMDIAQKANTIFRKWNNLKPSKVIEFHFLK